MSGKTSVTGMNIKVTKDGPYLVSGSVPLAKETIVCDDHGDGIEWRKDETYPATANYSLCRCGHSKTKPYCDASHVEAGFDGRGHDREALGLDGTETDSRKRYIDEVEKTVGPAMDLMDNTKLCAGSRFCSREGGTWDLVERSNDPDARRLAIEQAGNCPSGRLVVWDKAGTPIEPGFEPSIVLADDPQSRIGGPIWVRGGIPIEAVDGTVYESRNRVTLCRCGKSANKPFCDGAHLD